jgi:hypothetical protein
MSSVWQQWCDESQKSDLQSNVNSINAASFIAVTLYGLASILAVFFEWRLLTRRSDATKKLWPGYSK